jgi:hypothetical protein
LITFVVRVVGKKPRVLRREERVVVEMGSGVGVEERWRESSEVSFW